MKKLIKIGNNTFRFKKDALNHYKKILNSYEFGESLSGQHYNDIIDLLNYDISYTDNHPNFKEIDDFEIIDIRIGKVQFNTKCFELLYKNGETDYISYRLRITKPKENPFNNFIQAARNIIQKDITSVKQAYFDKFSKKGFVPCQETGILSKWEELVVDHRQPNTFSIIVDRFIELNKVDLKSIEYKIDENNFSLFKDDELAKRFREYHKVKAVLRIVRKECNLNRAHQGRVKQQKKDLKIN